MGTAKVCSEVPMVVAAVDEEPWSRIEVSLAIGEVLSSMSGRSSGSRSRVLIRGASTWYDVHVEDAGGTHGSGVSESAS